VADSIEVRDRGLRGVVGQRHVADATDSRFYLGGTGYLALYCDFSLAVITNTDLKGQALVASREQIKVVSIGGR